MISYDKFMHLVDAEKNVFCTAFATAFVNALQELTSDHRKYGAKENEKLAYEWAAKTAEKAVVAYKFMVNEIWEKQVAMDIIAEDALGHSK